MSGAENVNDNAAIAEAEGAVGVNNAGPTVVNAVITNATEIVEKIKEKGGMSMFIIIGIVIVVLVAVGAGVALGIPKSETKVEKTEKSPEKKEDTNTVKTDYKEDKDDKEDAQEEV